MGLIIFSHLRSVYVTKCGDNDRELLSFPLYNYSHSLQYFIYGLHICYCVPSNTTLTLCVLDVAPLVEFLTLLNKLPVLRAISVCITYNLPTCINSIP